MIEKIRRAPIVLWIYLFGFLLYSALPLIFSHRYYPANPPAIFAAGGAFNFFWSRMKRWYWFAVGMGFAALWYPVIFSSWRTMVGERGFADRALMHLTPALLLTLMLSSSRARRYMKSKAEAEREGDE